MHRKTRIVAAPPSPSLVAPISGRGNRAWEAAAVLGVNYTTSTCVGSSPGGPMGHLTLPLQGRKELHHRHWLTNRCAQDYNLGSILFALTSSTLEAFLTLMRQDNPCSLGKVSPMRMIWLSVTGKHRLSISI